MQVTNHEPQYSKSRGYGNDGFWLCRCRIKKYRLRPLLELGKGMAMKKEHDKKKKEGHVWRQGDGHEERTVNEKKKERSVCAEAGREYDL